MATFHDEQDLSCTTLKTLLKKIVKTASKFEPVDEAREQNPLRGNFEVV